MPQVNAEQVLDRVVNARKGLRALVRYMDRSRLPVGLPESLEGAAASLNQVADLMEFCLDHGIELQGREI